MELIFTASAPKQDFTVSGKNMNIASWPKSWLIVMYHKETCSFFILLEEENCVTF